MNSTSNVWEFMDPTVRPVFSAFKSVLSPADVELGSAAPAGKILEL